MEVRGDLEGVSYLLPPCGVQGLNSDCQARQRALLLSMTFLLLHFSPILFLLVICHSYRTIFSLPRFLSAAHGQPRGFGCVAEADNSGEAMGSMVPGRVQ